MPADGAVTDSPLDALWKHIDSQAGPWNLLNVPALAEPLPPIPWLCEPLRLAPGAVSLIAGYGYSRKTMALQSLALSVAMGRDVWGLWSCRKGRVVHLDYEQGRRLTSERYQRLARGMGTELAELDEHAMKVACLPRIYLETQAAVDSLLPVVQGAALVIVDSLKAAFPHADENSSDVRSYLDALSHLSERTGACVAVIHHARKPNAQNGGTATHAIRGSSSLFDACQSVYVFEGEKDTPTTVHHQKDRIAGSTLPEFGLVSEDIPGSTGPRHGLVVRHLEAEQVTSVRERKTLAAEEARKLRARGMVASTLEKYAGRFQGSRDDLTRLVGGDRNAVQRAISEMLTDGKLKSDGRGAERQWYSV